MPASAADAAPAPSVGLPPRRRCRTGCAMRRGQTYRSISRHRARACPGASTVSSLFPAPGVWRTEAKRAIFGVTEKETPMSAPEFDTATRTELEAAAFRRLVTHLRERTDVQNIDMMNLAGFCRNCLSRWYREEAATKGIAIADPDAREIVYGMPYDERKAKHQKEAAGDQKKAFDKAQHKHI